MRVPDSPDARFFITTKYHYHFQYLASGLYFTNSKSESEKDQPNLFLSLRLRCFQSTFLQEIVLANLLEIILQIKASFVDDLSAARLLLT